MIVCMLMQREFTAVLSGFKYRERIFPYFLFTKLFFYSWHLVVQTSHVCSFEEPIQGKQKGPCTVSSFDKAPPAASLLNRLQENTHCGRAQETTQCQNFDSKASYRD